MRICTWCWWRSWKFLFDNSGIFYFLFWQVKFQISEFIDCNFWHSKLLLVLNLFKMFWRFWSSRGTCEVKFLTMLVAALYVRSICISIHWILKQNILIEIWRIINAKVIFWLTKQFLMLHGNLLSMLLEIVTNKISFQNCSKQTRL